MTIQSFIFICATKLLRLCQRLLGASTVGVRAIILNQHKQILLVTHTYQPYWYLPGGGVKNGETARAAIAREIKEEAGIIVQEAPELFGVYFNIYFGVNDYPILFIVKNFTTIASHSPEISKIAWFDYANLPTDISPATKKRLDEYFLKLPTAEHWQ